MLAINCAKQKPIIPPSLSKIISRNYADLRFPEIAERDFEKQWRKMDLQERYDIQQRHIELSKRDWKTLTLATKKSMYTSAYDLPPKTEPNFNRDVFFGVSAIILIAYGCHTFFKWLGGSPPHTASPEWYEHTKALMRKQNASPIKKLFDD